MEEEAKNEEEREADVESEPGAETEPRAETEADGARMTIADHLEELRWRLIYALIGVAVCAGAAFFFGREIFDLLKYPYVRVMEELGREPKLVVLNLQSGFIVYLKISLYAGLVAASPWVFYQFWKFVSAALYPREKRYALYAAPGSALLFLAGVAFFIFVVSLPLVRFFVGFLDWLDVGLVYTLEEHVSFMLRMMIIFGLCFQTPLVVLVLGKMGIVTPRALSRYRRHVIIAMLVLAAVVTSPSPIDQVALALPMWLLYELGIVLVKVFCRRDADG